MPGVTENTLNDLLAQYLRERGLSAYTEFSGMTPHGRNQPDFVVQNSGQVFGEGEWESSFMKGLKQAHDFANIPGASGSFIISYPDNAKKIIDRRLKDTVTAATVFKGIKFRGFLFMKSAKAELFYGDLEEMYEWLSKGIFHKPWRQDATAFVSLMRDIVEGLTSYLPASGEYPTFFEHIIATMPKDAGELDTAKRAAAYLLLNQMVFYRILSQNKYRVMDPEEIEKPSDLHDSYFKRVLEDDYSAVFDSNVASLFPSRSLPFIKDMLTYINEIQPERFTRDLLGSIFHELIPKKVRKSVAAYYTNPEAARLLAKLTIEEPEATVADFACGSGTLLMAAYDRKAELLGGSLTQEDHKRFLEKEITGCDIMPFAAHLAVVQLALRQPSFLTDKVRVAVQDSTSLRPGTVIAPLQSSMPTGQTSLAHFDEMQKARFLVKKGAISGQGEGHVFRLEHIDATLMNPPFTRKQLVGKEYRKVLTERFEDYKNYLSQEQSLFGYFVFLADRFLKPGGRMGFVIPSSSIRQASSEGMRKLIRDRYDLEYLILSGHRMAFSEDADFSEILLVARKRKSGARPKESFILAMVKKKPSLENVSGMVANLKDSLAAADSSFAIKREMPGSDELDIMVGLRTDLEKPDWLSLLPGEGGIGVNLSSVKGFVTLREVVGDNGMIQGIRFEGSSDYVNVKNTIVSKKRGAKTRLNWEAVEENETGISAVNQKNGVLVIIPKEAIRPAIRSASGVSHMELKEIFDYVVNDRFLNDGFFWDEKDPDKVLAKRKPHLLTREGRLLIAGRNHIGLTSDGTYFVAFCAERPIVPTWNFWSVKVGDADDARIICLWLNSIFSLATLYDIRIAGEGAYVGWLKSDLMNMRVPDVRSMPLETKQKLLDLFNELERADLPSLIDQLRTKEGLRFETDFELARVLELPRYSEREALSDLYSRVISKFELLEELQAIK